MKTTWLGMFLIKTFRMSTWKERKEGHSEWWIEGGKGSSQVWTL